jgi:hypothetical protein
VETVSAVVELAEKSMSRGDRVKKTYIGKLDGNYGYLVMSGEKLLFVKEEGFIRKSRSVVLNLPYDQMESVKPESRFEIAITDKDGKKHGFVVDNIPVTVIEKSLNDVIKKE